MKKYKLSLLGVFIIGTVFAVTSVLADPVFFKNIKTAAKYCPNPSSLQFTNPCGNYGEFIGYFKEKQFKSYAQKPKNIKNIGASFSNACPDQSDYGYIDKSIGAIVCNYSYVNSYDDTAYVSLTYTSKK